MAGNGRLRHWQGREGSSLLRMVPAPGAGCASCHDIRFKLVCNCGRAVVALVRLANNCTTALRSLQFLGVSGCIPDYCASSKTKWLKQLGPGLIEQIRAECEHRLRDLTRAGHASLFDPLLNDLLQPDSTVPPPMASLHSHVRFGMERRARPPPIPLHLLPAVRTDCLRLPPISMLQLKFPWHLAFQLPP